MIEGKEILNAIESINRRLDNMELLMEDVVKTKKSSTNKMRDLEKETRERGLMEVIQVQKLLNISRPWALELMSRLGKEQSYTYSKGDLALQRGGVVKFNSSKARAEDIQKVKEMIKTEVEPVSFGNIMRKLNLDEEKNLGYVKEICGEICEKTQKYRILEKNKIGQIT